MKTLKNKLAAGFVATLAACTLNPVTALAAPEWTNITEQMEATNVDVAFNKGDVTFVCHESVGCALFLADPAKDCEVGLQGSLQVLHPEHGVGVFPMICYSAQNYKPVWVIKQPYMDQVVHALMDGVTLSFKGPKGVYKVNTKEINPVLEVYEKRKPAGTPV